MILPGRLALLIAFAAALALAPPSVAAQSAGPLHIPTFEQGDPFTARDWSGIARYVDWINLGNPEQQRRAAAAGMKTVWYQDPFRICARGSFCSDRPGAAELDDHAFMQCASGGRVQSSYSPNTDTYYGDPSSQELIQKSNEALRSVASPGHVDDLWLDNAMLLRDEYAERWNCPGPNSWRFADGTPYSDRAYADAMLRFTERMQRPVLLEGTCNGDGSTSTLGSGKATDPAGITEIARARNVVGALCESFAEGWASDTRGKAPTPAWQSRENTALQVQSYGKIFVAWPYFGNNGCCGPADPLDQRGYFYASFMLVYEPRLSMMRFNGWGARTPSGLSLQPEAMLVPTAPLQTAAWDADRIERLRSGGIYVREFAQCYDFSRPIGACAALVNPDPHRSYPLPALRLHYAHSVTLSGFGALTGDNGTPNHGDDGRLGLNGPLPREIGPEGWAILVR